jgi:hypothetical protein
MSPDPRRLYSPRQVEVGVSGRSPCAVAGIAVEAIREEWLLADRWWTSRPLHRHYYELVLVDGRDVVVFRCGRSGRWYRQRA